MHPYDQMEDEPLLEEEHEDRYGVSNGRLFERHKDRCYLVYGIFFFCGVVTLLPWNFFITAVNFFKFKLRNTSLPSENFTNPSLETHLQLMYENYLVIFASLSNSIFMVANVLLTKRLSRIGRFGIGNVFLMISFVVIITFAKINTDSIQFAFFCISISMGVLASAGCAFTQGSVIGMAGMFPDKYAKSVMEGQAVGGIVAACANILTIYLASDPVDSGLAYFAIALGLILLSIAAFLILPRITFSKQFIEISDQRRNSSCNGTDDRSISTLVETTSSEVDVVELGILSVFWKVKVQSVGALLVFMVTLSIFPAILAKIEPMVKVEGDPWTNTYFTPVICFLIFNTADYLGRTLIGFVGVLGRRFFWLHNVLVFLRIALIPLTMMCNVQPRKKTLLPVLFRSDAWPAVFTAVLGVSNGYLAVSCIILAVGSVGIRSMELAGNIVVMFIVFGIAFGGLLSLGLVAIV